VSPDQLTRLPNIDLDEILAETREAYDDPAAVEALVGRCSECGAALGGRLDSRTCSARCRQRRSRRRRRARSAVRA
jgi:hypothetical protein